MSDGWNRARCVRELLGFGAAGAVIVGLSACGSGSGPTGETASPPPDGIVSYALPLDPYILSPYEAGMGSYVENLLVEQCMNAHGYDWPVPRRDIATMSPSKFTSVSGRALFTVAIAQENGYRLPEWLPQDLVDQNRAFGARDVTDQELAVLRPCITDDARSKLPATNDSFNHAAWLANNALSDAQQSGAVKEAARRWRDCMAPAGIPDLPESPSLMPPDTLASAWGLGEPDTTANADEIRVATADATCRDESGYTQALYEAEWQFQSSALADDADQLARQKASLDEYRKAIDDWLAKLGG